MARQRSDKPTNGAKDNRVHQVKGGNENFKGYIQHVLTKEEHDAFGQWSIDEEEFYDNLERLVDGGYKISVSHDSYNSTVQASLTCNNSNDENFGWVLVARAPSVFDATRLIIYKHRVLMGGDWSAFHERSTTDRQWG